MRIAILFSLIFYSGLSFATENSLEEQLKQAIYQQSAVQIQTLLTQYSTVKNPDPILISYAKAKLHFLKGNAEQAVAIYRDILSQKPELNSIRMEMAIALVASFQDKSAQTQLYKLKAVEGLPPQAYDKINHYIDIINQRNEWQFNASISYVSTKNVGNIASNREIENTGFRKNDDMLPQKAKGFSYSLDMAKDSNITGTHYFRFANEHQGQIYWNNHQFDDISNRTLAGYVYKQRDYNLKILPFYEKRWYGNNSYHWSNGGQLSFSYWLSQKWQNQSTFEYQKRRFFDNNEQNGHIQTFSTTFAFYPNPKQLFFLGSSFVKENTQAEQYRSTLKNIRAGWIQEYALGISSQINAGFSLRQFKSETVLGGFLPLGKARRDKIYYANVQLWKRNWHLWGITPKLNVKWKKQVSNLPTLYSYQDHQINLVFEKNF